MTTVCRYQAVQSDTETRVYECRASHKQGLDNLHPRGPAYVSRFRTLSDQLYDAARRRDGSISHVRSTLEVRKRFVCCEQAERSYSELKLTCQLGGDLMGRGLSRFERCNDLNVFLRWRMTSANSREWSDSACPTYG